jgi:hypothetical protein
MASHRTVSFVIALMIADASLGAAQDDGYPSGRVIGAVEIPALHDAVNQGSVNAAAMPAVTLYIEPTDQTAVAAVVTDRNELASLEHGYELISAAVYDMTADHDRVWYQVHYTTAAGAGDAWLSGRDAGTYHPLGDMLIHGLAFLRESWDGVLYDGPRATARKRTIGDERTHPDVRVTATAGNSANLWLRIELLDGNVCQGAATPSVIASGWIPAHSAGRLTAWFSPRGC